MNRHDEARRHVQARAMAANIRHRAYGRYLDAERLAPLDPSRHALTAAILRFRPGALNPDKYVYGAKRAYQHDPSER